MELGLGSYAFRWAVGTHRFPAERPWRCTDLVDETARLGCTLLQIADNHEVDTAGDADLRALHQYALGNGVRLQLGCSGATPERLRRYRHMAELVGSDLVRLVLHGSDSNDPDETSDDRSVAALTAVAEEYQDTGIRIGIENHFQTSSSRLVSIVERVDSEAVGVILDVGNSIVSGEWPDLTVAILAPFANGVHLKDYELVPDDDGVGGHLIGRPLGAGRTNARAVLDAVAPLDDGRLGIVLEQWSPRESTENATLATETDWRERSVHAARRLLLEPTRAPGSPRAAQ